MECKSCDLLSYCLCGSCSGIVQGWSKDALCSRSLPGAVLLPDVCQRLRFLLKIRIAFIAGGLKVIRELEILAEKSSCFQRRLAEDF